MSMTLTIEIPALDRLCDWLESRDKTALVKAIEDEIVGKLKEAAEGGVPKPVFPEAPETEPEAPRAEPEPTPMPERPSTARAEPASAGAQRQDAGETRGQADGAARGAVVTLAAVQRAAAQLRDAGKLEDVKGLFPEFGIRKLSDLKEPAQLAAFAERLQKLGAEV